MKAKKYILCTLICSVTIFLSLVYIYSADNSAIKGSDQDKLSVWKKNVEDRPELLPFILGHKPLYQTSTNSIDISEDGFVYGMSQGEVLNHLGVPFQQDEDEIIYKVGNLTVSSVGNAFVPQNASLRLMFRGGRCMKYQIWL